PFGRRRARFDRVYVTRARLQRLLRIVALTRNGAESDPAILIRGFYHPADNLVGRDLVGGRQAQWKYAVVTAPADFFEQRVRFNALIEFDEEERIARMRAVRRETGFDLRRRRRERPSLRGAERATRDRFRSGGYFDRVVGRHREANRRLEQQSLGPEPSPFALRLRREFDWNLRSAQVFIRSDGDHRLRERDGQMRSDRHVAFGRDAQDFERA